MKVIIATVLSTLLLFGGSFSAQAAVNTTELQSYLKEIQLTEAELTSYLATYDLTLDDFEDLTELRDTLGPRVTTETVNDLLADYGMTREELEKLLKEYDALEDGKTIEESFLFTSDIEEYIWLDNDATGDDDLLAGFDDFFAELGITEAEMTKLTNHIVSVIEKDPTIMDKIDALASQMESFEDFETVDELSPAQISQLLSITDQIKNLLQLDFSFYLVKDGVKTPISFENLLKLTDAKGASLFVEVYSTSGELLLDFTLTGEMINGDLVQKPGHIIENTKDKVVAKPIVNKEHKTEKGAKLPNTAGNYMGTFLFGLALLGAAIFTFRKAGAVK
ncbi:processed acidic surface protein [Bacillus massiliigorillae]|uniref:processed acidic surface protein n=1 Tax=Bacillus massiliigorillae TaxID=1243664 RepID=UPI0003A7FA4C|nr:processed acidic surface protein [Bacillus massiliigorillae]